MILAVRIQLTLEEDPGTPLSKCAYCSTIVMKTTRMIFWPKATQTTTVRSCCPLIRIVTTDQEDQEKWRTESLPICTWWSMTPTGKKSFQPAQQAQIDKLPRLIQVTTTTCLGAEKGLVSP